MGSGGDKPVSGNATRSVTDGESPSKALMRTALICHHDAPLDHDAMVRWLGSFSNLVGIVRLTERPDRMKKRVNREIRRVGRWRFLLDVLPFRLYYKLALSSKDAQWQSGELAQLQERYGEQPHAAVLDTHSPNTKAAREFLEQAAPDIIIARCKFLLKKSVFSVATTGSFVMHPGVCLNIEMRTAVSGPWPMTTSTRLGSLC